MAKTTKKRKRNPGTGSYFFVHERGKFTLRAPSGRVVCSLQGELHPYDKGAILHALNAAKKTAHSVGAAQRHLKRSLDAAAALRRRENPNLKGGRQIYPKVVEIHAQKRIGSGTIYRHPFSSTNPIIGLPDGSLYIPARGARLWGHA